MYLQLGIQIINFSLLVHRAHPAMMLANLSPLYMPSAKPQLRRKSRAAKQRCLELPPSSTSNFAVKPYINEWASEILTT